MQRQPQTVIDALLPLPVKIGTTAVCPVTLGGALLLDRLHSPFSAGGEYNALDVFVAGYVLSREYTVAALEHSEGKLVANAQAWADTNKVDVDTLAGAIKGLMAAAFDPWAETKMQQDPGGMMVQGGDVGNGLGEVLTMLSQMCEWNHWTMEYVLTRPLSMLFALHVAHRINRGEDWMEPSYQQREADFDGMREGLEQLLVAAQQHAQQHG